MAEEEDSGAGDSTRDDEILHLDRPPPPGQDGRIIRMVNQVLEQALRIGASDIHLEPFEDECAIRLRVDGVLRELTPPSRRRSFPSSPASRSSPRWTLPKSACPRTAPSR